MLKLLVIILMPFTLLANSPTLELRNFKTEDECCWGLMNCPSLLENEGALFSLKEPSYPSFWMFNCLFDLSVAYLSEDKVIQEIYDLKAYPKLRDPKRPVNSINDFKLYPENDPIVKFFSSQSKPAKYLTFFALEVNQGWFERNHVKIGDKLQLQDNGTKAVIISSTQLELSH